MKKQLNYFYIDGGVGGNQDWFGNYMMNKGGCAAATACDSCVYLAREWGIKRLYPFAPDRMTRGDYVAFSQIMKPYISPRPGGVTKLSAYMDGLREYAEAQNINIPMEGISGNCDVRMAEHTIRTQIDCGLPVPFLLLSHQDRERFGDFIWHWFLLIGYEETKEEFFVTAATYGEATRLPLHSLWNTGCDPKGGLIRYGLPSEKEK